MLKLCSLMAVWSPAFFLSLKVPSFSFIVYNFMLLQLCLMTTAPSPPCAIAHFAAATMCSLSTLTEQHAIFLCPGDLTNAVEVCGTNYDLLGVSGCNLDTTYDEENRTSLTITYTVTDSAGASASVSRVVNLIPACPPGEELCPDNECSKGGLCQTAAPALEPAPNQPPTISLNTVDAVGPSVTLKRGVDYRVCGGKAEPTTDAPCELGATAFDPEDGNITAKVGDWGGALLLLEFQLLMVCQLACN